MAEDNFRCMMLDILIFPSFWIFTAPGHRLRCEYCGVLTILFIYRCSWWEKSKVQIQDNSMPWRS